MLYIFLADGFEEIEAITTIDLLRRAQLKVSSVSISDKKEVTGAHGITIHADILFSEAKFEDAEMLILPGGMPGTDNLHKSALPQLLTDFNAQEKNIAAICAAPLILGDLGILEGKKATCYPGFESHLGNSYVGGILVDSKNIITAKGPGVTFDFALSIIEKLCGKEMADKVAEGAIY